MRHSRFRAHSVAIIAGLLAGSVVSAHHGDAGRYDENTVLIQGTVVTLMFINPHSQLVLDVTDENGETVRWHAEFGNPNRMNSEFGWDRDILKPGDEVTLIGRRLKSGAPFINLTERAQVVMTKTGEEIYRTRNFVAAEAPQPE